MSIQRIPVNKLSAKAYVALLKNSFPEKELIMLKERFP